ncbi:hypothetical protein KC19_6G166100 [Ceratodon purpureus]|uniref:Methyltransferase small domain-containing protein n=1 Tax=Ceratodon purpureus TaxID=3225 RepID=A0A8T0HH80_CERPU|nr:hypothetical protein KC19_6G166100 [Ceratodon purpureus]
MASAFVRLSQSIGALSISHCGSSPLFRPCSNSIRRHHPARRISSLFSSLDCWPVFPLSEPSKELQCRPSPFVHRLQKRIGCSALSDGEHGGSAFYSTSAAAEASVAERSLYCESVTRVIDSVSVVTPLCERPATHVTCLEDLLQWRRKAELLAASVGKEFYEADGGPDSSDLLRELEWLLDDAVAACCRRGRTADSSARCWEACSWRDVKACLPVETLRSLDRDNSSNESADVSLEFGVFGTLLKERYTDPVAELAADGACCCDSLRDSLANMACDNQEVEEASVEGSSFTKTATSKASNFPTLHDAVGQLNNQSTNAHVLLRASIEELEEQWTQRVRARRPFQYVVGCTHWRDLVLSVQEGVLIPRPETEQMIDLAEAAIAADDSLRDGLWADLGTGSGALAIALARLLPSSGSVIAIDASPIAVAVARRNVEQYELMDRVKVVSGSWFTPLENHNGSLAGVLSNPPYIPSENITGLQAEVGKHEPQSALDGGEDGMNDLRIICQGSSRALRSGGFLALETNGGKQAESVADLLHSLRTLGDFQTNMPVPCFQNIRIVPDFAGIMRFVVATRC